MDTTCVNCSLDRSYHEDEMGRLHHCKSFVSYSARVAALRTRVAVLEAALRQILRFNGEHIPLCSMCRDIARVALNGATE